MPTGTRREGDPHPGAAIWSGQEKAAHVNGRYLLFDLQQDPTEQNANDLGSHPLRVPLEALVGRITHHSGR